MIRFVFVIVTVLSIPVSHAQDGSDQIATLRLHAIESEPEPPRIADVVDSDIRRERIHPMQPPTIPHRIDNYQLDLRANRCMSCHSRTRVEESGAPMVSVTHYTDRDGVVLAEVSPRRFFCTQCHVAQTNVRPLVGNTFEDVSDMLAGSRTTP